MISTKAITSTTHPQGGNTEPMICGLTGVPHRLFWMRSAWWCHDCRQKIEGCCEGPCPSVPGAESRAQPEIRGTDGRERSAA
jgi:hypothetical protein